jgi:hypothetical protein
MPPHSPRHFPPPWFVTELSGCFVLRDNLGQQAGAKGQGDTPHFQAVQAASAARTSQVGKQHLGRRMCREVVCLCSWAKGINPNHGGDQTRSFSAQMSCCDHVIWCGKHQSGRFAMIVSPLIATDN